MELDEELEELVEVLGVKELDKFNEQLGDELK
jgi:hypothetical protein